LENINDSKAINRTWENIKENINSQLKRAKDLFELKQYKPWFDEGRL